MIAVETDGDVRTVTLDRPARRNALRGTGSAFCAGVDLDAVAGLSDRAAAERFAARGRQSLAPSRPVTRWSSPASTAPLARPKRLKPPRAE